MGFLSKIYKKSPAYKAAKKFGEYSPAYQMYKSATEKPNYTQPEEFTSTLPQRGDLPEVAQVRRPDVMAGHGMAKKSNVGAHEDYAALIQNLRNR